MPTGYTAELMDKGQDFRSFALSCARAMGACIMQRDDPMNDPPKKQEQSDYYAKALATARQTLADLKAMTPDQQEAHGSALRDAAIKSAQESLERDAAQNHRIDGMVSQVKAWTPPTDEHQGLRNFMLEQLNISRNDDVWSANRVAEAKAKRSEAYFIGAISGAVRDIAYHEKSSAEDAGRVNSRNDWIEKLYASLPSQ